MSKDRTLGGVILLVCIVIAVLYTIALFFPNFLVTIGLIQNTSNVGFWIIAIPVFVAFVAIMSIGAWIGLTMARTSEPKPNEEIVKGAESENKLTPT